MSLKDIFGQHGFIARSLPGYEERPQQVEMAYAVERAVSSGRHLLVEAGTGVGKSLGYLIPLIKWAKQANKRALASTYTKTLQEQLVKKDLPFLRKILGIDFSFALCLGGQNYLCLRRLDNDGLSYDLFAEGREKEELNKIAQWRKKTQTGLRLDLGFRVQDSLWDKVCRQPDICLGRSCPRIKECFYARARARQYRSQILVTNHHLYFANLAAEGNILPAFDAAVFDEAHSLEGVAGSYLGIEISHFKIKYLLDSLFNPVSGKGFLSRLRKIRASAAEDLQRHLLALRLDTDTFFSQVAEKFGRAYTSAVRIREKGFIFNRLKEPLLTLASKLSFFLPNASDKEEELEIVSFLRRAKGFASVLEEIIGMSRPGWAYWVEAASPVKSGQPAAESGGASNIRTRQRRIRCSLCAAPIDISGEFRQKVLDKVRPVIFVSATLSTEGNFGFIRKRLGINEADEVILGSPFDYGRQAMLYLPCDIPDPNLQIQPYQEAVLEEIVKIIRLMQGRTFVLFTSFKMLDAAHIRLKRELGHLNGLNILRQGEGPRYSLLKAFRQGSCVLLGTKTFWQGIDVPGRALECVIISRLPFSVPDEPLTEARLELLRSQGLDPFRHYSLPQAIILLKQGFGRLIRAQTDSGVVAILDPRLNTRRYGRDFLSALPACRRVRQIGEIERFFSTKADTTLTNPA